MSEEEYQRYLDRHQYDHPVDEETRKISTELTQSQDIYQDHKQHTRFVLRGMRNMPFDQSEEELWEEFDFLEELHYQQRKIRNNARTHKKRIKGIKRNHE